MSSEQLWGMHVVIECDKGLRIDPILGRVEMYWSGGTGRWPVHLHECSARAPGDQATLTYQPPGAVDREFLLYFSIFLAPDPWKMPARKLHCDHFAPIFVPRTLTASQIVPGIIFQKNAENVIIFTKTWFQHFLKKSISHKTPEPRTKTKNDRKWII